MQAARISENRIDRVHLVGIGGSGMSALAGLALSRGMEVSGSDIRSNKAVKRLTGQGIRVFAGHSASNLGAAEAVVFSSAVSPDNPEILAAKKNGIPVLHRSDLLALMMKGKSSITVAGSHGKSTVTGMLTTILAAAGEDPSMAAGAEVTGLGGGYRAGKGRFLVAEADESDGSFLKYHPFAGILTNIDTDHLNNYGSIEKIVNSFLLHLNSISGDGFAVCCLDDVYIREILGSVHRKIVTYGTSEEADYIADGITPQGFGSSFIVRQGNEEIGRILLPVPGNMNALNALAAVAFSLRIGIDFATVREALESFQGMERRMEFKGSADDIRIIDDYAHHPTEIKASLQALSSLGRRTVVVFQPHRYSRTEALLHDLAESFQDADLLALLPVYAADEKNGSGNPGEKLAFEISRKREMKYLASIEDAAEYLDSIALPGDLVITMGAGDVWKTGEIFLEKKK